MDLRKQAIGIDISKDTFTTCLGSLSEDGAMSYSYTLENHHSFSSK